MSENYQIVTDKELHDDERISAYLRDRMPEEEEVTFLEELNSYSELRSKAISTAHLAKAMKKIGEENDEKVKEAISALQVLGYNRKEIEKAFGKLPTIEMSTEELIRKGLVALGK